MEKQLGVMPSDAVNAGDYDADEDPALSHIMDRLSINPASIPLAQSPRMDEIHRRQHGPSTNPFSTASPARRVSSGASRKIAGNRVLESQTKSPHPLHKVSTKTESTNPTLVPINTVPQQLVFDNTAPTSLPASNNTTSTTNNDKLPVTAASVAEEYFRNELLRHETAECTTSKAVVVIHDACYGHRYSRRKTTKSLLSTIVERPERIQAVLLGVSNAYVRIGEHYTGGKGEPRQKVDTINPLPFVIRRTTRSVPLDSLAVTNVHGTKWMQELTVMCNSAESRLLSGEGELTRIQLSETHTSKAALHAGDLYLCRESLEALQGALGGVLDGVDEVFRTHNGTVPAACKKAFVCIRPPGHHCSADMPSGFCWLNNVHVGIEHAAQVHGLTHAAIIDFDLHHGDGSQTITWHRNDKAVNMPKNAPAAKRTSIGYFSLHDINSYPCEAGEIEKVQNASLCIENAHGQSIWNVHLQPWKTEAEFWELYHTRYLILLDKAKAFLRAQSQRIRAASVNGLPKAAIFISAGFDASEWEGEGMQRHKVNVPTDFYARFTSDINRLAEEEGTSVDGRVISVLEGGYSDRALTSSVLSHLAGLVEVSSDGIINTPTTPVTKPISTMPSAWWSPDALDYLESIGKSTSAQAATKKSRLSEPTFHATPTESFLAKVVDRTKVHRTPPPVNAPIEIDWATAAYALSKLLIPNDRQINSCRHDELNEPRAKKDRQSIMALPSAETITERVQTRGRKPKSSEQLRASLEAGVGLPVRNTPRSSRASTNSDMAGVGSEASNVSSIGAAQTIDSGQTNKAVRAKVQNNKASGETKELLPDQPSKPARTAVPGPKVHRTRRVSGLPQDLLPKQELVFQQSLPGSVQTVETAGNAETSTAQQSATSLPFEAQDHANAVENLTSGIKRITLKLTPKEDSKSAKNSISTTTTQKASLSKTQKSSTSKPSTTRATKVSLIPTHFSNSNTPPVVPAPVVQFGSESPKVQSSHASPTPPTTQTEKTFTFEDPVLASSASLSLPITAENPVSDTTNSGTSHNTGIRSAEIPLPVIKNEPSAHNTAFRLQEPSKVEILIPGNIHIISQEPMKANTIPPSKPVPTPNPHQPLDNFIPYIVGGGGQQEQQHQQRQKPHRHKLPSTPVDLTWLPPNSKTPPQSPSKQKGWDLPAFTANSYIPFAGSQALDAGQGGRGEGGDKGRGLEEGGVGEAKGLPGGMEDVWAVPETPKF